MNAPGGFSEHARQTIHVAMGGFAPLVGEVLGVKTVPISYSVDGKRHSVEIPGIMQMAVRPIAARWARTRRWSRAMRTPSIRMAS